MKHNLPIDDLNIPMFYKPGYKFKDGWHFNEIGEKELAKAVIVKLEPY